MNTNAYTLTFSDGKRCTLIDPEREKPEELERSLKQIFQKGYLVSVKPGIDVQDESAR